METIRETGLCCPDCGHRNMRRAGLRLYQCQHSGQTFMLFVRDGFPALVPIEQAVKLEALSK